MLFLGAINKNTGDYVYPKIANKKDQYVCPECNRELILCKGVIIKPYFRHKIFANPCNHYTNCTESQIHKDAKMLMKTILESKTHIKYERECTCKKAIKIILPKFEKESNILLEYRFRYNSSTKIADIAHILNGELKTVFEIKNTHKTKTEDRPEPWVEIDASWFINYINTNEDSPLIIKCLRRQKCEECIEKVSSNTDKLLKKLGDDSEEYKNIFNGMYDRCDDPRCRLCLNFVVGRGYSDRYEDVQCFLKEDPVSIPLCDICATDIHENYDENYDDVNHRSSMFFFAIGKKYYIDSWWRRNA